MEKLEQNVVNLYNARPDFIAKSKPFPSVISVGEVQSKSTAPFTQMVVASLDQMAKPDTECALSRMAIA